MVFEKGAALYAVDVERQGGEDIMYVNYMQASVVPSVAQDPRVMGRLVEVLAQNPGVSRVVFLQQRN